MRHVYSVVRFVPDPARAEAVNIGIIAGSDESGEWALRTVGNYSRARRFDDRNLLPGVRAQLEQIEAGIERFSDAQQPLLSANPLEDVNEHWLAKLSSESANILQFAPPLPVLAESADEALDQLWDELIVDPTARRFRFAKKHRAVSAVTRALKDHGVSHENFARRVQARSRTFQAPMDFAFHNGHITQLTNCWSFQLPDKEGLLEEVTSWAWAVRALRGNGGSVVVGGKALEVGPGADLGIDVVYVPPADGSAEDMRAFESARMAFDDPDVKVAAVPDTQADTVAQEAARRLGLANSAI